MNKAYRRWGFDFLNRLMRHVGSAGVVWCGISLKYQEINWTDLGVCLVSGAVLPTLFNFFAEGIPKDIMTEETVITKTTTIEPAKEETK